ncbi:MAG: ribonuclease Z [Dysosmobacter sp.]
MIAVVCVDDRNGMLFHHRRQSQDRLLREDLLSRCPGRLWMNAYSAKLFTGHEVRLAVNEDFLSLAGPEEWCFVEDRPLAPHLDRLEGLVVYRWNRAYPADVHLDLDLSDFQLESGQDFSGSSHETITREIYRRTAVE